MTDPASSSTTVLGTCHHDCPDSCGWEATVADGVVTRLRGNPDHPYSLGELCPKVNRFVSRVYAPDRLLAPMLRVGPKGSGQFERTTWDRALEVIASAVGGVIDEHGGEAVMPWWDAGTQGVIQMSCLDRPFFAGLGASRLGGSLCGATARHGFSETCGSGRGADPSDVAHSDLVILWGTNTRLTNRHLWPFVDQARGRGARVVVIDPLRTVTAESADLFIQPLPGTDVALILSMINVIVADDLVDHDYVERHTTGIDELVAAAAPWTPERAGAVCGLAPEVIAELARAYATTRPAMIRTLIGAEHHRQGSMFFRTLACLPTLVGSWRELGGGLARSVGAWASDTVDDSVFDSPSDTRVLNMNHLGRNLCDPEVGVHALFVWCGNPVVSVPNAGAVRRGLARDDLFVVVSEQFMTDTARFADVILPATTQLEHVDVVESWGHLQVGWNEPAIEPRGEAVANTEMWRRLAAAMSVDDPRFALSDEELVTSALVDVDIEVLRRDGFVRVNAPDVITPYADGGFGHPDGRARLGSPPASSGAPDSLTVPRISTSRSWNNPRVGRWSF